LGGGRHAPEVLPQVAHDGVVELPPVPVDGVPRHAWGGGGGGHGVVYGQTAVLTLF